MGWSIQTPRPKNPKSASPEEAEAVSGVPTFGVIRTFEAPKKSPRKEEKDAPSSLES